MIKITDILSVSLSSSLVFDRRGYFGINLSQFSSVNIDRCQSGLDFSVCWNGVVV
jgi:hypothetical protein